MRSGAVMDGLALMGSALAMAHALWRGHWVWAIAFALAAAAVVRVGAWR